ncbi:MAG TPA: DUF4954 family protein [Chitinivibrionales bacterium]
MATVSPINFKHLPASSEFLSTIAMMAKKKSKSRLFGSSVRPLFAGEIKTLKANGNHAQAWNHVLVHTKFDPASVCNSFFYGRCVLGCFNASVSALGSADPVRQGIYNCTVSDSEIGSGCCLRNSSVFNYCIGANSVVTGVGSLASVKGARFGNGKLLRLGIETGGREVLSFAEMTLELAQAAALRRNDAQFLRRYQRDVEAYCIRCMSDVGIVETDCLIRNTPTIENAFIGKNARIDTALLVSDCTILSSAEEPTEISSGAMVSGSCIQWGCAVSSMAIVDQTVLLEHSHVKRHGKVTASVIAPNTEIAEGEVTACLVGPFVGFHHQALLIGTLWPDGKGNVGYGANVGSNHTGKAPDQELWCGEGVFFGLGMCVKFPANFTKAPYSVFATGITTLPQVVEFPFSLINAPSKHIPALAPSYNEIFPGWTLSDNIYMVKRNEKKYRKRNTARRTSFTFEVFRPAIIDLMIAARNRLRDVAARRDFYTASEIGGLGKNYMTETSRKKGIAAYDFFIEYYCLRGLHRQVSAASVKSIKNLSVTLYATPSSDIVWEHQRNALITEGLAKKSLRKNLMRLIEMELLIAESTQRAKEKDDVRGVKTIPDYNMVATPAMNDPFVKKMHAYAQHVKNEVMFLLKKLD